MAEIKQFSIGGVNYNVVRASAAQQDEVLSMLTAPITERMASLGVGEVPEDDFVFNFFTSLPYAVKEKLDSLLLSRLNVHGSEAKLDLKDFDGRVLELNQLRAQVLLWNLMPFFVYWASVIKKGIEEAQAEAKKRQTA